MLNPRNWFVIRIDYGYLDKYYLVTFGPGWIVLLLAVVFLHFFT